jgi:hypothetical protein
MREFSFKGEKKIKKKGKHTKKEKNCEHNTEL